MPPSDQAHPALRYEPMLADGERMRAYRAAIQATVRPGDIVADLGTGTGVLAVMAAQAGAGRVYAVDDHADSLEVARRVIEANGVADRVVLIEGDARVVELPEPVDLALNELIGHFGTDENIIEIVRGFLATNLAPRGRVLPSRLQTFLAPVCYGPEFRGVWSRDHFGVDLTAALSEPEKPIAILHALEQPATELAPPALLEDIVFEPGMAPRVYQLEAEFRIERGGPLQGFAGFFEATLSKDVVLRNWPGWPGCHWKNWNWPVVPPREVQEGEQIAVELVADTSPDALAWRLRWEAR